MSYVPKPRTSKQIAMEKINEILDAGGFEKYNQDSDEEDDYCCSDKMEDLDTESDSEEEIEDVTEVDDLLSDQLEKEVQKDIVAISLIG